MVVVAHGCLSRWDKYSREEGTKKGLSGLEMTKVISPNAERAQACRNHTGELSPYIGDYFLLCSVRQGRRKLIEQSFLVKARSCVNYRATRWRRGRQEVPKGAVHLVAGQPFPLLMVVHIQDPIVPDGPPRTIYTDQGRRASVFDHIDDRDKVHRRARKRWEPGALLPEQGLEGLLGEAGDVVPDHDKVAVAEGHGRFFLALTCSQSRGVSASLDLWTDAASVMIRM
jgi:hypothetical protein